MVQQKVKKDHKPLAKLVEELGVKVVLAANKLQGDLPSVTPSAEQPGASSFAQTMAHDLPKPFGLASALK